jgi:azurin
LATPADAAVRIAWVFAVLRFAGVPLAADVPRLSAWRFAIMRRIRPMCLCVALLAASASTMTAQVPRVVEITGTDDMKYSVTTIQAKRSEMLRIRLKSVGNMPKAVMAHNVVVLAAKADPLAFTNAAVMARATDFIPPKLKNQVLAATGLAGRGETVEVTLAAPKTPGKYVFVCTFPGHFASGMRGTLIVK